MPRVVSFIVLVAILALVAAVFFQVMAHFVVPLFLAAVLVVVFEPLHLWVSQQLPGRPRIAALGTTLLILLAVLLPTAWLGWKATVESRAVIAYLSKVDARPRATSDGPAENLADSAAEAETDPPLDLPFDETLDETLDATDEIVAPSDAAILTGPPDQFLKHLVARAPEPFKNFYRTVFEEEFNERSVSAMLKRTSGFIGHAAFSSFQIAIKLVFGMAIMVIALYYFLADGPKMLASMMQLSPLDDQYERELLDKFANVSRAVVVASLASAIVQGLLAGIGYYFALNEGAPIFLLTMATMVLAIVPFAGAAAIWVPTAIWIYLYQTNIVGGEVVLDPSGQPVHGDTLAAIGLAIYGTCVVSAIDNVIKPLVLHGQSKLHPLVAFMSILGGVQTLGPVGILVGPMLVAFIQALLGMVNKELHRMGDDMDVQDRMPNIDPGLAIEAGAAAGVGQPGVLDVLAAEVLPPAKAAPRRPPAKSARPTKARSRRKGR